MTYQSQATALLFFPEDSLFDLKTEGVATSFIGGDGLAPV